MEEELKHLIDGGRKSNVRKISEFQYLAVFLNKLILDTFSKSKGIDFTLYTISAKVARSNLNPNASSVLETGWVKIFDIPPMAKNAEAVKVIAELAGEVLVVDELSL
jgi:hypothetical protein